jgi:hypothetical protein
MEGAHPHLFGRGAQGVPAILPGPPGRWAQAQPAGGVVGCAGKAVGFDEGLHQADRVAIAVLPILGQAPGGQGQEVRGQMGHPHPGQDQKTLLVGHPSQTLTSLRGRPANKLVPRRHFPGRRAKDHHRQLSPLGVAGQVLHILANGAVETPVVILRQQLSHPSPQFGGVGQFQAHRLQELQAANDQRRS